MQTVKRMLLAAVALLAVLALLAACGPTPEPEVVERIVTQVVEVKETVEVEVEKIVEKEVTIKETVQVEIEKLITPTPTPARDVIIVALSAAPTSLDPADHRSRNSETVIRNMFDGLVTRDTRSGVHLELAESMEWIDGQTLEVNLRQGVLFHDGVEMTADDVVFYLRAHHQREHD